MKLPVLPLPEATDDVAELYSYFLERGESRAEKFLDCLHETYEMIVDMPELGPLYHFKVPAMKDARIRKIKKFPNHLIFYRIGTDNTEHGII